MGNELNVERLSEAQLRSKADAFLRRYHPSGAIPVPIEEIVDLRIRIDVIPMPGLRRGFDVEAFITSDMEAIYVDDDVYRNHPNRYRFSLAHEIAHAILHQRIYRERPFHDLEGWKQMQASLPDREYGWLEWQAYAFAGLVLVPGAQLKAAYARARDYVERQGISLESASEVARHIIAGAIAREFHVSTQVVEKRMISEQIWESR